MEQGPSETGGRNQALMLVKGLVLVLFAAHANADEAVVFCEKHEDCQPGLYVQDTVFHDILAYLSTLHCTALPSRRNPKAVISRVTSQILQRRPVLCGSTLRKMYSVWGVSLQ